MSDTTFRVAEESPFYALEAPAAIYFHSSVGCWMTARLTISTVKE